MKSLPTGDRPTVPPGILKRNEPDRFTVNSWRPNLPKLGRLFLRYGLVIMSPQHRGDFIRHLSV